MNVYWIILVLLIAIASVLGVVLTGTPPESVTGAPHPNFQSMNQGGDVTRHSGMGMAGWIYGSLQIALFGSLIGIGAKGGKKAVIAVAIITLLYLAVFSWLMMHATSPNDNLLIGTWTLILGMWPFPAIFVILYFLKFDEWIYSPEQAAQFDQLIAENHQKMEGGNE